jgi:hypothetical protein
MTDASTESQAPSIPMDEADNWEWWSKIAVALAIVTIGSWCVGMLRLGSPSVVALVAVIPLLGMCTMPVMFWGLLRTILRPPAIRKTRTIGFVTLLVSALWANTTLVAPPLTTEEWRSSHTYRLPFDGMWSVTAGGDDIATNYHGSTAAYRWGYDFTKLVDKSPHRGDGSKNEDHHSWSAPVRAPVAATVVFVQNGIEDHLPGEPTKDTEPFGNHIVLQVAEDEFVFLAHLQHASISVQVGDKVEPGQALGAAGNSGHSVDPHIHMHGQNKTGFPFAESLPIRFSRFEENGKLAEAGMPSGQTAWKKFDGALVKNF